MTAVLVAEAERAVAQPEAVDRVDEARRPAAAAELAVGDRRQADRLLEGDDLADAFVLQALHFGVADLAGLAVARGLEQALGPQEAADMLDPGRRPHCGASEVFRAQQLRALDHRLQLAVRDLARQVLHAAVGREDHVLGLDVLQRALRSRSATVSGVSTFMSDRSMQPTMICLPCSCASTAAVEVRLRGLDRDLLAAAAAPAPAGTSSPRPLVDDRRVAEADVHRGRAR